MALLYSASPIYRTLGAQPQRKSASGKVEAKCIQSSTKRALGVDTDVYLVLRSLKTVHKSAPPRPRRLWRSSPHPRLRFAIQLASSDPPGIVYLVAVGEIYPG